MLGRKGGDTRDKGRKAGTPFHGLNTQGLSKSLQLPQCQAWRAQCTAKEDNATRKGLGVPHYQDKSIFNFLDFCLFILNLAHCLWDLSRTTPISLTGKYVNVRGVTGPHAHTHMFLLRMSGCMYEGTKAVLEKLQAATPPTPFTCWAGVSFPLGSLDVEKKLWSCLGTWPLAPGGNTKGEFDITKNRKEIFRISGGGIGIIKQQIFKTAIKMSTTVAGS